MAAPALLNSPAAHGAWLDAPLAATKKLGSASVHAAAPPVLNEPGAQGTDALAPVAQKAPGGQASNHVCRYTPLAGAPEGAWKHTLPYTPNGINNSSLLSAQLAPGPTLRSRGKASAPLAVAKATAGPAEKAAQPAEKAAGAAAEKERNTTGAPAASDASM